MANSTSNIDLIAQAQASKELTANAALDAASPAMTYGRRQSTCSGLTWGFFGGNVTLSGGTMSQIANGTLTLTASATNYIVANKATGAVSFSTATTNWNDSANYWRLYSAVVGAATVTSYTDSRELAKYTGGGSTGAGSGTVTTVSVDSSNGFSGSVANPTTTPAITLSTGVTGLLKGAAGALVAATNADLPAMSATVGGAVPTPPNDPAKFLNGQGAFVVPSAMSGSVNWGSIGGTLSSQTDLQAALSAKANSSAVPAQVNLTQGTNVTITGTYPNLTISSAAIPAQFNPIAGTNVTLTGTYPNITINSSGGGVNSFIQPEYGSVSRGVESKLQEIKSVADYATFADYLSADLTNAFFVQNGSRVFRQGNRSFFGGAVANDGAYPNVEKDWLTVFEQGTGLPEGLLTYSQAGVLIDGSGHTSAWLTGSQSKDAGSADASCLGSSSIVVNNHATLGTGAWAFYGEAHRTTAAASWTCGMELDTRTLTQTIKAQPVAMGDVNALTLGSGAGVGGVKFMGTISGNTLTVTGSSAYPGGSIGVGKFIRMVGVTEGTTVTALGTGTGGDGTYTLSAAFTIATPTYGTASDQYDASAAIQISSNYLKFKTGINFQNTSITGCDGVTGIGTAISFASGHAMQWFNNSGQICGSIYNNNTDATKGTNLVFQAQGCAITGPSGGRAVLFPSIVNSANYLSIASAVTGGSPYIAAIGDANCDITLIPAGTGKVSFGVYTAGAPTVTGYITMKLQNGTAVRVPVANP